MLRIFSFLVVFFTIASCSSIPKNLRNIHIISNQSALAVQCKKISHIYTDTRGNPFNFNVVAETAFRQAAYDKGADSAVITNRQPKALGRVILEGSALNCYE